MHPPDAAGRQLLRLCIADNAVLRACYMPFLLHKGLFVPSRHSRKLGEKLFLILTLANRDVTAAGMARVCWITPAFCSDGREAGYGVHFDQTSVELRTLIESALSAADDAGEQMVAGYTL